MARIAVKYAGPDRRRDHRRAALQSHAPDRRQSGDRRVTRPVFAASLNHSE